jgi:CxxC-x17-CxxC domain-containing protein
MADKPVDDAKPAVKPKAKEPPVEEPKEEKPASSPTAPAGDATKQAGTDQSGRQLYDITCAACGKPAQVPFKPSGDRPVYCRDCYMKQKRG